MDRQTNELVQRLCLLAGMIMEDIHLETVSVLSPDPPDRQRMLRDLSRAGAEIAILLAAAAVLDKRLP